MATTLRLHSKIRTEYNVRSRYDRRVFVTRTTVEYYDANDHSIRYRKSFERKRINGEPEFPVSGTSKELNAAGKQW